MKTGCLDHNRQVESPQQWLDLIAAGNVAQINTGMRVHELDRDETTVRGLIYVDPNATRLSGAGDGRLAELDEDSVALLIIGDLALR